MEGLPSDFRQFLAENEVDERLLQTQPSLRYVRFDPRNPPLLGELQADLQRLNPHSHVSVVPVDWMPGFCGIPADVKIASCPAYRAGRIYGMDVSSAVSVDVLDLRPGDQVLDLCCAPGVKLLYAAERLAGLGSITGVDISESRLHTCRSLLQKYGHEAQLFQADGCTFEAGQLYDKVMVDAECTHEGSLKHLQKFQSQWGWDTFKTRVLDTHAHLAELQRGLADSGVRLLRPGGKLVYSTCSFCRSQNEDVVQWLLQRHPQLHLCDLRASRYPALKSELGLRFDPITSNTGGQFVALFSKDLEQHTVSLDRQSC